MPAFVLILTLVVTASAHAQSVPPVFPVTPPAGWTTGEGYPEPRQFIEAQWHDAPDDNLEQARHFHLGAAVPRVARGVFRLDLRVVTFHHFSGIFAGIRKALIRVPGGAARYLPAPVKPRAPGTYNTPLTQHMHEFYVPLYFDTRSAREDGTHLMEIDATMVRDDGRTQNVRLQVPIYLDNGDTPVLDGKTGLPALNADGQPIKRTLVNRGGAPGAEGWISNTVEASAPFGYLRTSLRNVRRFEDEAPALPLEVHSNALPGASVDQMVTINPDLHKHPPLQGTVIVDRNEIFVKKAITSVMNQPPMIAGDRLMARTAVTGTEEGAGATLLVVTLGSGSR